METKRINGLTPGAVEEAAKYNKATKTDEAAARADEAKKQRKDFDVQLSDRAKDAAMARAKAKEIAKNTPPVREDRVAALKKQIADGTYKVDAGNIADGMLREAIRDKLATTNDD